MSTLYVNNIEPVSGSALTLISASLIAVDDLTVTSLTSSFQGDLQGTASFATTASHALNSTSPSGVSGAIQFSDGLAFASDAANLFWDDTNNRLGVGTNAPTQALDVNGSANFSNTVTSLTGFRSRLLQANTSANNGRVALQTWDNMIVNVEDGGVGIAKGVYLTPSAQVHIKGSGTTSATTSLLVQNSAGSNAFRVLDDGGVQVLEFIRPTDGTTNSFLRLSNATGTRMQYASGFVMLNPNFTFASTTFGNILEMSSTTGKFLLGGGTQDASAKMQLNSTTEGFLPPRMTTTQKNAIATPASGLMVYDTDLNQMSYYNGTSWVNF